MKLWYVYILCDVCQDNHFFVMRTFKNHSFYLTYNSDYLQLPFCNRHHSLMFLESCNLQAAGQPSSLLPAHREHYSTLGFYNVKPFRVHMSEIMWCLSIRAILFYLITSSSICLFTNDRLSPSYGSIVFVCVCVYLLFISGHFGYIYFRYLRP